jgi:hypothetical protein
MPPETSGPVFTLHVGTDPDAEVVRLRLTDEHGRQLGSNQVRLAEHKAALWQGLFDTRAFVRTYADSIVFTDRPATATELLDQIGVFLGEKVLGPEILKALHKDIYHRSLRIYQPDASKNRLAAAFARVPWEIARPAGQAALFERNLVVRMETAPDAASAWRRLRRLRTRRCGCSWSTPRRPARAISPCGWSGSSFSISSITR